MTANVASHGRITDKIRPRPPSLSGIENGAPISASLILSSMQQAESKELWKMVDTSGASDVVKKHLMPEDTEQRITLSWT
jgi:hypothetical protein